MAETHYRVLHEGTGPWTQGNIVTESMLVHVRPDGAQVPLDIDRLKRLGALEEIPDYLIAQAMAVAQGGNSPDPMRSESPPTLPHPSVPGGVAVPVAGEFSHEPEVLSRDEIDALVQQAYERGQRDQQMNVEAAAKRAEARADRMEGRARDPQTGRLLPKTGPVPSPSDQMPPTGTVVDASATASSDDGEGDEKSEE